MTEPTAQHQRVLDQIAAHDRDLAELRADISGVQTSIKHVAEVVKAYGGKLDEITAAVGARGRTSAQDLSSYLQIVALLFAIISGIVTGIVYIATNASASRTDLLQYKVDRLYGSFGWEPAIRREEKAR